MHARVGVAAAALLALYTTAPAEESDLGPAPTVVVLEGSPAELGCRHGRLLGPRIRLMLSEYIGEQTRQGALESEVQRRVRTMAPSLPSWYRRELCCCAAAAGVAPEALLFAQCEGDIKALGGASAWANRKLGCTAYFAFGPATADGQVEVGRNFDYWGLRSTAECATVFAYRPEPRDGHAFVSVGWTGILGGWTFYNDRGLFVCCNLGRLPAKDPRGVPNLVLLRMIAQQCATVSEAVELLRRTPRMHTAALVLGQAPEDGPAAAATVHYDAATLEVTPATAGFAFHSSIGADPDGLRAGLRRDMREPFAVIRSAGSSITLHSVAIRPAERGLWVAQGRPGAAHQGDYRRFDLRELLRRNPRRAGQHEWTP